MTNPYIGRLAPSPTGLLHLGHAATFWQAFERAHASKRHSPAPQRRPRPPPFQTRIRRSHARRPRVAGHRMATAHALAIRNASPSTASPRTQLLALGHIYPCHCSRKDLASYDARPARRYRRRAVYNGHCRPARAIRHRRPFHSDTNYRFRVPDGETITFDDRNLGPQSFIAGKDFGDFLIWRKALSNNPNDGLPSYQLACVVDDADTHITEVVRGRDLLKSTARQTPPPTRP